MSASKPAQALRLLFVTSIPRWGGGERWMLDAAAGLGARGHDVLLAARPHAQILDRARAAGVPVRALTMGGDFDPRPILGMRALLWHHRPHAVFVNLDKELRYVCFATPFGTAPLLFARRGSDDPLKNGRLQRFTYGRLTRLLTNSATLARTRFAAQPALPPDRVRVLPNGVPVPQMIAPVGRTALRRELRLPRGVPLVLHVGELEARKGQATTLRALAELLAARTAQATEAPLPVVAFLGTGPDEADLHVLCHELGVKEHVLWVGFRKDVESYLDAADLLVLPSRREGVPWTLLEAMAHRLPVIASTASGIPEIVQDGATGLLVPPDDPAALARAMDRILLDASLAARLADAAQTRVRTLWSADHMLDDLEALVYAHLLARRRRAPRAGALFVDRDGTLVGDVPYNGDPQAVQLEPNVGRALRWVRDAGWPVIVASNQSGVARGLYGEDAVRAVNAHLNEQLRAEGAHVQAFYYCPHHPEHGPACDCRKPAPGMLLRAAAEHGVDLTHSFMVGDAPRDLEAGRRAGATSLAYRGVRPRMPDHEATSTRPRPAQVAGGQRPAPASAVGDARLAGAAAPPEGEGGVATGDLGFAPGTRIYSSWMAVVVEVLRTAYRASEP